MANFFPRWTNYIPLKLAVCAGIAGIGVVAAVTYYATPKAQRVGYMPAQPIPYNHELHVQQLGLDCRYCHSFVEHSGHANVPTANTCWNCHQHVKKDSPQLEPLRRAIDETYENYDGKPIEWVRVHQSPDYAYFNHSAHVNRGVSCENLRPLEEVYNLDYDAEEYLEENKEVEALVDAFIKGDDNLKRKVNRLSDQEKLGHYLKNHWNVQPKESCATCHR